MTGDEFSLPKIVTKITMPIDIKRSEQLAGEKLIIENKSQRKWVRGEWCTLAEVHREHR